MYVKSADALVDAPRRDLAPAAPSRALYGLTSASTASTVGRIAATIFSTPSRVGCNPSLLTELGIARHAVEKERIERDAVASWPDRDRSRRSAVDSRRRRLGAARMPVSSVAICAARASREDLRQRRFGGAGSMPRSMSLAPSSTISASVPAGTLQSKRASPSAAVSPETPALATSTSQPRPSGRARGRRETPRPAAARSRRSGCRRARPAAAARLGRRRGEAERRGERQGESLDADAQMPI